MIFLYVKSKEQKNPDHTTINSQIQRTDRWLPEVKCWGLSEKDEGNEKYKLVVTKQSQGHKVQHRESNQQYCNIVVVPGTY